MAGHFDALAEAVAGGYTCAVMEPSSRRVLIHLWPPAYAVAKLDAVPTGVPLGSPAGPPVAVIAGHGEVTLIAPEEVVGALGDGVREVTKGWRLLTLDVVFPHDTVGVLRAVSSALAETGVPLMALSSYDTDHFLVPGELVGRALAALHQARLERLLK
jgi:uncharacterized protein